MEYRSTPLEVRVTDRSQGIVEARVNQLEVVDDYTSVFADGVFDRAIARRGKYPKVLVEHEGRVAGKVTATNQYRDTRGLWQHATMQFNLATAYGRDAYEDVIAECYDEWSVGFRTLKDHHEKRDARQVRVIDELDWFETSAVLAGASPGTGTMSVRGLRDWGEYGGILDLEDLIAYRAVAVKEGAPKSPPAGYPSDSGKYADSTNFKYPIDSDARIHAAVAYFNHSGQREAGGYTTDEWATIGRKIAAAANKAFGGGYAYENGQITTPSASDTSSGRSGLLSDFESRVGARNNASDAKAIQGIHDACMGLGAACAMDNVPNQRDAPSEQEQRLAALSHRLIAMGISED